MSDNVINIFDRFSQSKISEGTTTLSDVVLEPYHAAKNEKAGRRAWAIRIYYSNGDIEQINYSHRKYDLATAAGNLFISFTTGVVVIKGKNLNLLLDDLQDERIRSIQGFDPAKHLPPKEGQPVIDTIEWKPSNGFKQQSTQPGE